MTELEIIIRDLMYLYADKGIITIPTFEKEPAIWSWNDLAPLTDDYTAHMRIDDMIKNKCKPITGLAIVLGKENPTLSCCDIDSYDAEIINRVLAAFPSSLNKVGRKGCSFFYRNNDPDVDAMLKFKIPSGGQIEIFNSNKYIVIPPSLHSYDGEVGHYYSWVDESCTFLNIEGIDDLPFIPYDEILNIEKLVNSASTMTYNKNVPITLQYDANGISDGRNGAMGTVIGSIIKRTGGVISISEVTAACLKFDSENSPNNSFFDYTFNKKHKEIKKNRSKEVNANEYCASMIHSISKRETITFKESMDVVVPEKAEGIFFHPIIEIKALEEKDDNVFLPEYIPPFFRAYCVKLAASFGHSLHTVFFTLLGALGGTLQSKFIIRPIKNNIFFQRTNLSTVLLAYSGSKKSDLIKIVMWRCMQLNEQLKTCNPKELLDNQRGLDKRMESLHKARDIAFGKGEGEEASNISNEIYKLQDEMTESLNKIKPTIWLYHSATVQKMIHDHSLNSANGLFFTADEFNLYLQLMHKKGNEEFRNYMMECQNGDGIFESSTLSRNCLLYTSDAADE